MRRQLLCAATICCLSLVLGADEQAAPPPKLDSEPKQQPPPLAAEPPRKQAVDLSKQKEHVPADVPQGNAIPDPIEVQKRKDSNNAFGGIFGAHFSCAGSKASEMVEYSCSASFVEINPAENT